MSCDELSMGGEQLSLMILFRHNRGCSFASPPHVGFKANIRSTVLHFLMTWLKGLVEC